MDKDKNMATGLSHIPPSKYLQSIICTSAICTSQHPTICNLYIRKFRTILITPRKSVICNPTSATPQFAECVRYNYLLV
jgi:hypothetical protein